MSAVDRTQRRRTTVTRRAVGTCARAVASVYHPHLVRALTLAFVTATTGCSSTPEPIADSGLDVATSDIATDMPIDTPVDPRRDGTAGMDARGDAGCLDGSTACGATCADLTSDVHHCGRCDRDCTMLPGVSASAVRCATGACVLDRACTPGRAHCTANPDDGCETDVRTATRCGDCTTACTEPTPFCAPDVPRDGGTLGYGCVSGCPDLAPTRCSGACVDIQTDALRCGSCDHACPTPPNGRAVCTAGTCSMECNGGFHACSGSCLSNTSVESCGMLCTPCPTPPPNATASCDGLTCSFTCNAGFHRCGPDCLPDTSPLACGTSCTPCPVPMNSTATCNAGRCGSACSAGYHLCSGACVSDTSVDTCGGRCTPCPVPFRGIATCDGTECGGSCLTGMHLCGDTCVSNTNPATCGNACTPCPVPVGGSATCDGTACGVTCFGSYHACGGTCVYRNDPATCGDRCTPCPVPPNSTATCPFGTCTFACAYGYALVDGACIPGPSCNTVQSYGGHHYVACYDGRTWPDAEAYCRSFAGWHLASATSTGEADFLLSLGTVSGEQWIGLNDRDVEGTFVWSTGEPVSTTRWCAGEPNDQFGNEDCVLSVQSASYCGTCHCWNDSACTNLREFICELDR